MSPVPPPKAPEMPERVWSPDAECAAGSAVARFAHRVRTELGVQLPSDTDYAALHAWSVRDLPGFWSAVAEFGGVRWHETPSAVLASEDMPGAVWFPGGTLNYAERALAPRRDEAIAIVDVREDGHRAEVTHAELRDRVARARVGLREAGVGRGDRVVALTPNCVETVVLFLAAASLGAVWSSCSPDFGARAVRDRFAQIEPTVLLAVDGYRYGGRTFDISDTVRALRDGLPTLRATVVVPRIGLAPVEGTLTWSDLIARHEPLQVDPVPFDHPLWVLYSSGTTGLPKAIVHSHGGILLEHLKSLRLHGDLGAGDRFLWFTTTGWMMWNYLVGALLVDATIVLFDGNPGHPDTGVLWRLVERERITYLGVSASFVQACRKAGTVPRELADLSSLRTLGSTGSPLSAEGFRWIADACGDHVQISSISGGTDLCTAFLTSVPTVPVHVGELSVAALGADVHSFDEDGHDVVGEDDAAVGELVITRPMPSMPTMFWNDPDGSRLRESYYETYDGVWRHGDWVRATPRGSFVVYGRSDSTLNRGGIRMGTADFYAVVEAFDAVTDSLVVDTTTLGSGDEGALLCFLTLNSGTSVDAVEPELRRALRYELSPRHVPDAFVVVDAVPRTLNGKKCEVPVKRILAGVPVDEAVSRSAVLNPDSLRPFVEIADRIAHGELRGTTRLTILEALQRTEQP